MKFSEIEIGKTYLVFCPYMKNAGRLRLGTGSGKSWKVIFDTDWSDFHGRLVKVVKKYKAGHNIDASFLDSPSMVFSTCKDFLVNKSSHVCSCLPRSLFISGCQCGGV